MIKVKYTTNKVTISGHANFAEYGKDIVCASVSSIVTTSVNDMYTVLKDSIAYSDNGNIMIIEILINDELVIKLFNNMLNLLKNLSEDYPKNIIIESEE